MFKKSILALVLAAVASPAFSNVWTLDTEQCIATRTIAMNGKPSAVQYTSVGGYATFVVTSPGWGLPAFNYIRGLTVEHEAGNGSDAVLVQRTADSVAVVWKQTEKLEATLRTNTTDLFRVMLPGDKEMMSFVPLLGDMEEQVRSCVVRQNTV